MTGVGRINPSQDFVVFLLSEFPGLFWPTKVYLFCLKSSSIIAITLALTMR